MTSRTLAVSSAAPTLPFVVTMASRARVLLVDDSAFFRKLIKHALGQLDLDPVIVDDGLQALELGRREVFDLVVTDLSLPGLSGDALVRQLKQVDGYAEVPFLVVSATWSAPQQEALRDLGVLASIRKPISPRVFQRCVQAALDRKTAAPNAGSPNSASSPPGSQAAKEQGHAGPLRRR